MKGNYPKFTLNYSHEELIEHFLLSETEQQFIQKLRGDTNRHGAAILLKSLQYLGYFPYIDEIPVPVKLFIAKQLNLVLDQNEQYPWNTSTRRNHVAMIRQHTGFRFPSAKDKDDLENWLRQQGTLEAITFPDLFEYEKIASPLRFATGYSSPPLITY